MNPQSAQPELATRPVSGGLRLRSAARIAWSLWMLSVLLTGAVVLFYILSISIPLEGRDRPPPEFLPALLVAFLAFSTVGALIASRRPENSVGWIFCGLGVFLAGGFAAKFYADYALIVRPGSLPGGEVSVLGLSWTAPLLIAAPTFVLLLFPDGRLPSRRWRPVTWLAAGGATISILGSVFRSGVPDGDYPMVTNPVGIGGSVPGLMSAVGTSFAATAFLLSVISMILRFRHSRGKERQQIKWIAYAGGVMIFAFAAGETIPGPELFDDLMWAAGFIGLIGLPVAAGIAILRHDLYDIDLVVNRTLVYGVLTVCVAGVYVLVVGYLGTVFRADNDLLISLVAAGVVAVLFAPLRDRLQRAVNRLMYGERDDPYAVLSRLGQRLEATLEPGAVLPAVAETVATALKLPYAAIELKERDGFALVTSHGSPTGSPVAVPLVHQHETVGRLLLVPRAGEEGFSPADRRLIEDLARQVATAAHAVRLTSDLQRARERLVTAREEERRRLRRDLHDGLGPQLSSQTLTIDAVRELMRQDPDAAEALLLDLKAQSRDAVADVRRLVYALRPPALDDLGLVGALRATAQHASNGPRVSVEAPDNLPPLPAAVEVAAYRIAQEALTNVVRHAGASRCVIRLVLDEEAEMLRLEVEDDGRGIGEERGSGVGLHSMRERARELGGGLTVGTPSGRGTVVRARLPLATPSAEEER
jgi:signal transduction histidine kinase